MADPYARKARVYAAVVDRLNRSLHGVVHKTRPGGPGVSVLDVGCGTGAQLVRYVEVGSTVSGVDLSEAMLSVAQDRLGDAADLQHADAANLPYADGSFDTVLASLFLHELPPNTADAVVSELARVVSPDGRVVITDFGAGELTTKGRIMRTLSKVFERAAGREHFNAYRRFLQRGGVPALIDASPLEIESQRRLSGGDLTLITATR